MAELDLQGFKNAFHGNVFEPSDAGYDNARQIWNASVEKRPRIIAQCSGVVDVT